MNPIIDVSCFSLSLEEKEILKEVSFYIKEGEFVSIVGPNGAGKTTLLKCLMRIHSGGKGSINVSGLPLQKYAQKDLARLMSYVPQLGGMGVQFTVKEFVLLGRYPYLSPFTSISPRDIQAVENALSITSMDEFSDRSLDTLSGGERQRVWIAAALAQESRIILLDEPTAFLDPRHAVEILDLLRSINKSQGVTVISVTHDINSALITSDRILALKEGKVVFFGDAEHFMDENVLHEIYGTRFCILKHPVSDRAIVFPEFTS